MEYIRRKLNRMKRKKISNTMSQIEDIEIGKIFQTEPEGMKKTKWCTKETCVNLKVLCIFIVLAWPVGRFALFVKGDARYCNECSLEGENGIIWTIGALWLMMISCILTFCLAGIAGCLASLLPPEDKRRII